MTPIVEMESGWGDIAWIDRLCRTRPPDSSSPLPVHASLPSMGGRRFSLTLSRELDLGQGFGWLSGAVDPVQTTAGGKGSSLPDTLEGV